ncbi:peptidoglycan binding protein CsiV [Gammaproteobacteria bacterium]|nr:peptidoglycan binding protein CsiV [Gammaproteobacteria bacterium]MDA9868790.1 peptidoglycan binding protein CsiV [Gammaproteobacteria bacterium]
MLLFFFVSSNAISAKDLKEYYIEVIVFEQLEITQEEDLSPVLLDLKPKNLISLLERQVDKINTEAVEKSFETKVGDDLLSNLEIIDLEPPLIIEPDDAKEEKRYILQTDKWFERNDQLKELNNIYRRLDRRNEYKVLHKISWIQPALPDEETPYVHEIFDTHGLLIRLYQSRYLHLDLIGYMNGNLESNENEEQIELIKFAALQESIPEDVEQIDIPVSSDLLYLESIPTKIEITGEITKEQAPKITEGMVEYILREDRRVFQNESHFFDHPKMGIIVSVYDSSL